MSRSTTRASTSRRSSSSKLGFDELNKLIEDRRSAGGWWSFGACTGTDTHTVGIDAILNMKGFSGDYGLERYPWFEAYNLGSQVPNAELIRKAEEKNADAILVSPGRDPARRAQGQLAGSSSTWPRSTGSKGKMILLLGGPRVDHKLALELGFDAGFGPGTKPSDVANFIVHAGAARSMGKEPADRTARESRHEASDR